MNSQSEIENNKKVSKLKTLKIKRRNFLESKLQNISWSKYKAKCEDLVKTFGNVPDSEKLIYDCTCALQKDILYQGRLYVCLTGFYFHAQVFMKDTIQVVKWNDVLTMKRSKTAKFFPNAILIESNNGQIFLTSFGSRDKTFLLMHRLWQCAIGHNEMSVPEMNLWMRYYYRDLNLGDGSRVMSPQNQKRFLKKIQTQLKLLHQHLPYDFIQEFQLSGNEKFEDQGQSDSGCAAAGLNLLSIPPFDGPNDNDSNDGSEVFSEDSRGVSQKLHSPILKSKRNAIFPLKKSHSRSFEHLERELHKAEDLSHASKDSRKEEKNGENGMITRVHRDPPEVGSEESGQDSDMICQCGHHEELSEVLLDNIYPVNVNILFKHIFHKRCFWSKVLELTRAKDVVLSPWTTEADENGARVRNIAYTLSLNYPFSPKHSLTTEKQVLHADSTPGEFYLVDTECVNNGLPYGEDFYIVNRYCISKISENSCRLRITSQIKYRKKVWGLIKSFIDKNATAGILETFNVMGHLLRREANQMDSFPELNNDDNIPARKKPLRRKLIDKPFSNLEKASSDENQYSNSPDEPASTTISKSPVIVKQFVDNVRKKHDQKWFYNLTFAQAVHLVTAFAIMLCLFNVFLYFKMHSLESVTSQFEAQLQQERNPDVNAFQHFTNELEIGGDMKRWKDTMSSLVLMMEDVANSVSQLEQIITLKLKSKE